MEGAAAGLGESCSFFSPHLFFSQRLKEGKKHCPPFSLFVLSNLTYVIYQKDRLFGKPDGPRQKSSGFSKHEKLGSGGPGGKAYECVCVCVCLGGGEEY